MAVKPGYKQTEVGVIPEEWEVKPFGALFTFRNGVNADKNSYGQGVRFINVLEPITYSHINGPEIQGQVTLPEPVSVSYEVRLGDVLFNRTSETQEEVALAATYLGSERVVFGGFVIRGRPTAGNLDPVYSGYALRAPCIRSQIIPMGQGAIRANIGQSNLSLVLAPVPPLSEQRAIATVLSDMDALLGALERLIAKKRDLKQAAMQQLLTGQTRLPGFHGEWEVKRLGEICEIAMGRTPPRLKQALWGHGYKWLSIADLQTKFVSESKEQITELAASTMTIIPKGTLLMSFKLSIGRLCFAGCDLFTNEAICSFNKLQASGDFLYYALGRTDFSLYGKQAVKGYTLNKESLKIVEVHLPPLPEQTAIAAVLTDMDSELAALEQRLAKTRALKQGMMQELLTGRTRLL